MTTHAPFPLAPPLASLRRGRSASPRSLAARHAAGRPRSSPARRRPQATFKSGLDLVVVNVVVRDKDGKLVRGLDARRFRRPRGRQAADGLELRLRGDRERVACRRWRRTTVLGAIAQPRRRRAARGRRPPAETRPAADMKDRRLIVLFYDLGSMQPEEVSRAVQSGRDYVEKKMAPADILAVVSLTTSLTVDQDFTSDRAGAARRAQPPQPGRRVRARRRRHRRGDRAGHGQRVRGGRHRVQHLQHRPPPRRAALASPTCSPASSRRSRSSTSAAA